MTSTTRPTRLRLPDTLDGPYTALLIGTYGANLEFAEGQLFRQLNRNTINRVVLADAAQMAAFLTDDPRVKRLNRAYVACPVRSPHAHHPKFVMLVGPTAGRLHVGSGNLSISGYAGPGECFTTYEWSRDDPQTAAPFAAVRDLVDGEAALGWLDPITIDRIRDVFESAPWIPAAPFEHSTVIHNLYRPLIDQLTAKVAGREVTEIVAAAPFHDRSATAIGDLVDQLAPRLLRLLVQDGLTRLNTKALNKVVVDKNLETEIVEARTPAKYPQILLHAKFILVRTPASDVLLQGSANLSAIALCRAGPDANVEIANLLEGPPGHFDDLLLGIDLEPRPDKLDTFQPDEDWGDDESEDDTHLVAPRAVVWLPPQLSGLVADRGTDTLDVRIAGKSIIPTESRWSLDGDWRHFALGFSDAEALRIDRSRVLELVDGDGTVWSVYPYHLNSLVRLSASGHRVDLLQEIGDLDLRDKELEELVAELDRVLIVDGASLWRLTHPDPKMAGPPGDEEPTISYAELDWDRIGELPQMKQYGTSAHQALLAPTELGVILASLTSRFQAEVRSGRGEVEGVPDDGDDLAVEPDPEDADALDDLVADPAAEEEPQRRLAPRTRVRRLWRNFVRRFINGLSDIEFVESVGSTVIIPSYIVFNHLCRRLRVVDLIDADYLTEAQLALWSFMWGEPSRPGYLDGLPEAERSVAQQLLNDHDDLPATIAAIDDAWWHVWDAGSDPRPLRNVWRGFLQSDHFHADPNALSSAAAVAMRADGDPDILFDDIYGLAELTYSSEMEHALASQLGVAPSSIRHQFDAVIRSGQRQNVDFIEVTGAQLEPSSAGLAIALWQTFEPDQSYFRLKADNAVAILDLDHDIREFFNTETGEEHDLAVPARPEPLWEQRLAELIENNS